MTEPAIRVEGLGKKYRLGGVATSLDLRETVAHALRRIAGRSPSPTGVDREFWALRDVSFDVGAGEVVGLIGRNGAGKTTLLKLLSRITQPSAGRAHIRGRVASLLQVGTGFHPELTGRENVFLNGAIMGMRRAEIDARYEDIVKFAEIDRFMDTPVKHYSSGMYVRLAFAVAAHLDPEVLLIDEVLAVGDAAFQRKCLGKMDDVAHSGRTILFVSHNMGAVQGLCPRAVWIDGGRIAMDGPSDKVVRTYVDAVLGESFQFRDAGTGFEIERVTLRQDGGRATREFHPGEPFTVEFSYRAKTPVVQPLVNVGIHADGGLLLSASMAVHGRAPPKFEGAGTFGCHFPKLPLMPRDYSVTLGVRGTGGRPILFPTQEVARFHVVGDVRRLGVDGELLDSLGGSSFPLLYPYEWIYPDGSRVPFLRSPEEP